MGRITDFINEYEAGQEAKVAALERKLTETRAELAEWVQAYQASQALLEKYKLWWALGLTPAEVVAREANGGA